MHSRLAANPQLGSPPPAPLGVAGQTVDAGSASVDSASLTETGGRRHVIVMIGDGMHLAHEIATSRYLYGTDRGLSFHALPEQSYMSTWNTTVYDARASELDRSPYSSESFDPHIGYNPSIGGEAPYPVVEDNAESRSYFLSGIYPDSAATSTAMSTGIKTYSGAIAWRPDGGEDGALETSSQYLRRVYGMSIGFVTTVPLSHATPAGFFAHNQSRSNYAAIAHELFTMTRPEVMIGSGWKDFTYYDASDFESLVSSNEYVVSHLEDGADGNDSVLSAAVRANQEGKRLLGLYGGGIDGSFASPVPVDNPGNPHVERGSIESPTLANASIAALEVLSRDPQGFFLLIEQGDIDWANHANDFSRMIGCVSDLDAAVRAVAAFVDRPNDALDWTNTTLMVTADHANSYMRFVRPLYEGDLPAQDGSTYPDAEITYGTGTHTTELVALYAKGYAATKIHDYENVYPGTKIIDNTSLYRITLDAAQR